MDKNEPPDYIKKKILMYFMRTSFPRILEEERSKESLQNNKPKNCQHIVNKT